MHWGVEMAAKAAFRLTAYLCHAARKAGSLSSETAERAPCGLACTNEAERGPSSLSSKRRCHRSFARSSGRALLAQEEPWCMVGSKGLIAEGETPLATARARLRKKQGTARAANHCHWASRSGREAKSYMSGRRRPTGILPTQEQSVRDGMATEIGTPAGISRTAGWFEVSEARAVFLDRLLELAQSNIPWT